MQVLELFKRLLEKADNETWIIVYKDSYVPLPMMADAEFRRQITNILTLSGYQKCIREFSFNPPDYYDDWTLSVGLKPDTLEMFKAQLRETVELINAGRA